MNLEKKIEIIREKLNNMLKNEDKLTRTSIINVSQELDKLIVEYYNNAK
ncbi:MAG: aspartyl-phosphate phosphatase Spo0E family protein [Clostridium sp.]|nr:aspartyl-phosphate phosphatase Spo0E family protein [Clostridium sp.]